MMTFLGLLIGEIMRNIAAYTAQAGVQLGLLAPLAELNKTGQIIIFLLAILGPVSETTKLRFR